MDSISCTPRPEIPSPRDEKTQNRLTGCEWMARTRGWTVKEWPFRLDTPLATKAPEPRMMDCDSDKASKEAILAHFAVCEGSYRQRLKPLKTLPCQRLTIG